MSEARLHTPTNRLIRLAGGRFHISPAPLETLIEFVQDEPYKPESGGVLLGRHIHDTRDVIVDQVTTPLPGDRRHRLRFFRSKQRHQELIDRAWRESGGTCTYLGEWHTHPEPDPAPSIVDQLDWRRKLMVDTFSEAIFFVIVGIETIRVWEGHFRGVRLYSLQPRNGHGTNTHSA